MFDDTHYVPILKAMQGELSALESLSPDSHAGLTPLLEVPPMRRDSETEALVSTLDEHLAPFAKRLEKACGSRSAFVDLGYLPAELRMADGDHPLQRLFADARALGLGLIPVTGPGRDPVYQETVSRVVAQDRRGVCLRVEQEAFFDGSFSASVAELLARLGLKPRNVDLVLDLGELREEQLALLQSAIPGALAGVPALSDWRTLTLVGGAFPESLGDIQQFGMVSRLEWRLWKSLNRRSPALPRMPAFGDYAVQSAVPPEPETAFFPGSANIRYTCDDSWAIFRGRQLTRFGHEQFYALSESLQQQPFYAGPSFSWGDQYIHDCAQQVEGPGNNTTWRKVGTSHHLTFVVRQLASLSEPSTATGPRRPAPRA